MRRKLGQASTPNGKRVSDGDEPPSTAFPALPWLGGGRRGWTISLVTALFLLGLVAIVTLMLRSAEEQDNEARHLAERQLGAAIASVQRSVASTTLDYAWWDDAYHSLAVTYSKDWAAANLTGATVIGPDKLLQGALVFDQAGQLIFGTWRGQSAGVAFADGITGGLPQLLDRARGQDAGKPEAVSGLLSIGGQPSLVAAAPIVPFSTEEKPPTPDRRFVLVFLKVLDPANLDNIGGMMGSSGLRLLPPMPATSSTSDAVLLLRALDGSALGEVHWLPPQPGHAIIGRLVPQIAIIVCIMALLAGLAIWLMLSSQHRSQLYLTTIDAKNQRIENTLKLWRVTTEAIDYGITVFDRRGRLLLWNLAYQRVWNMPDTLLHEGSNMVEMVEWVLGGGGYRLLQSKARDAERRPHEGAVNSHWVYQRDERTIEVQRYAVPEIGGFISISRDMTASRHREAELVQAWEEAVMASRAKSEFLANISHELRTPLNAIIGFSEVLEREIFGPVGNDRYRSYISDIKASGSHLLSLINDILDLSKIEAGKFELRLEKVDCSEVIETVARLIRPRAEAGQLEFMIRRPAEPISLLADERALKQVLINLLSNAVKFTPRGGQVDISCHAVPTGVAFSVRDTGIGISAKDIETALAPFGQIDSNLARRFDGTGLGLPIVRGICELHGGTLTIDSEIGRGTTVTAVFPDRMAGQAGPDSNVLATSHAREMISTDATIGSASLLMT
jgi:signal transduction histidine kinase/sensor domain CHASE-containing protein